MSQSITDSSRGRYRNQVGTVISTDQSGSNGVGTTHRGGRRGLHVVLWGWYGPHLFGSAMVGTRLTATFYSFYYNSPFYKSGDSSRI
jgi:hypothetical protein